MWIECDASKFPRSSGAQCGVLLKATSGRPAKAHFSLYDWLSDDFSSECYLIGVGFPNPLGEATSPLRMPVYLILIPNL